jgi:hypothetical protein
LNREAELAANSSRFVSRTVIDDDSLGVPVGGNVKGCYVPKRFP